jgi:hypothetical protein
MLRAVERRASAVEPNASTPLQPSRKTGLKLFPAPRGGSAVTVEDSVVQILSQKS